MAFVVLAACGGTSRVIAPPIPARTGDVHDFDFLVGAWTVENETLTPEGTWKTFASSMATHQELGGVVNVEINQYPTRGFAAMALRVFDLAKRRWAIYWVEGRAGVLLPPVHGGFTGDRGEFYGHDTERGRPVLYRYLWTRIDADHARWEQAYSADGQSWTTNWKMRFTRAAR
jgi:hypothetical protein